MKVEFPIGPDDARRLETVLRKLCPHQSLGALHKALRQGDIRVNGAKVGPDARLQVGDTLAIWDALLTPMTAPVDAVALPTGWLLWEGRDLVVLNKPSGLLVHRGDAPPARTASSPQAFLDERVRAWLAATAPTRLAFRPGPLHRLDKETSGLVVFSRTLAGAQGFSAALAQKQVTKTYLAVLQGTLAHPVAAGARLARDSQSRTTVAGEDGQEANSWFRPLASAADLTLVEVDLGTGRTHQIRVHAQSLGHALAGDEKYGGGPTPKGLDVPWLLHAWKLQSDLLPPLTAPLPEARKAWVEKTFKISL